MYITPGPLSHTRQRRSQPSSLPLWLALPLLLLLGGCPPQAQVKRTKLRSARQTPRPQQPPTGPAVWHTTTPHEQQTMRDVAKAQPSNIALLRLALLFSGPRTAQQAAPYLQQYSAFVASTRAKVAQYKDPKKRGAALLREFHVGLLRSRLKPQSTRYTLRQTRIDVLFKRGTFNCLSSAIVFGLLAQEVGFRVKVALMPTHAFVELQPKTGGAWIPVETTSPLGFAPPHNPAYYAGQQKQWAVARGLRPATYAEYKARDRRDLRHVICRMALWTHLPKAWPNPIDQRRLREIAGALDNDPRLQGNRLATWINTYQEQHKAKQYKRSAKLLHIIGPAITQLSQRQDLPTRVHQYNALLHAYWLEVSWRQGNVTTQRSVQARLYALLTKLGRQPGTAANHLKWLFSHILDRTARAGKREEGTRWLDLARKLSPQHYLLHEGIFWNHLGNHWLRKQRWPKAISTYQECLQRTNPNPDTTCKGNLLTARYNWAVDAQRRATKDVQTNRFAPAVEGFRACIQRIPPNHPVAKACQHGLAATYYNWAANRVQNNDKASARQHLKACLQLPKPLPQCRQLAGQLGP